jgi:hypothetical protein
MGGLSGQEAEFRRRGLQLPYWHNQALETRTAKLAFGIPYEILLGILCHSNANVERAADFFLSLAKDDMRATAGYLAGFIARLAEDCDPRTGDLAVTPEKKHTAMDFPRPSPTRLLVWDFAERLARDRELHTLLAQAAGADRLFPSAWTTQAKP